ncbi:TetR/AcrR family transcriptional regulator [Herbiconiux sp. VKM Ac-2851]|uniref:TetR/AcrR family transcriptional regulator n=1 Tax=Herbiconiux sp. VKM Ac-2851 TaxID=2739025 RepID=UPI001563D156|nr:TetR/AcrR family transcriptional regulator [Herbiconiux sp. VKM Ac-2851]NQX34075.1 TetR/AcrR family transcriptional regulator [Herbiconiux sp. VKM Ac-2851]
MTSTRREQAEARREQLLEVTLELFIERGLENVTVADVATRAGVTPGLLYHYFESKDELVAAVLDAASPRAAFAGLAASLSGRPAEEGLREFSRRAAELLEARGDVIRILLREVLAPTPSTHAVIADIQQQVLDDLSRYLDERIAAGELRQHDPRAALRLLISGLLVLGITRQPVEPWIDGFVDTVLHGITTEE